MKRIVLLSALITMAIGAMAQMRIASGPKNPTTHVGSGPSIPLVIRSGGHPSSQSLEGEAQFVRNLVMNPSDRNSDVAVSFSMTAIAKALDVDKDKLAYDLAACFHSDLDEELIAAYDVDGNLIEGMHHGVFVLDAEGRELNIPDTPADGGGNVVSDSLAQSDPQLPVVGDADELLEGGLMYAFKTDSLGVSDVMTLAISSVGKSFEEGDVCRGQFALNYEGKTVVFDITTVMSSTERGASIPLSSMQKVGEQVLDVEIDMRDFDLPGLTIVNDLTIDADKVASAFGEGVSSDKLGMYVMTDYKQQLVTDYFSYHDTYVILDMEGCETDNYGAGQFYGIQYLPTAGMFRFYYWPKTFVGGEVASGSIFLASEGRYYEFVLNMRFGYVSDEAKNFDVIETEKLDVRLMDTNDFYTYTMQGDSTEVWSLVSTELDMKRISDLLGTETPVLYAEQLDADGSLVYTRKYTAQPGQGFWLKGDESGCYACSGAADGNIGVYMSEGALRWYESPENVNTGDEYAVNLYIANPKKGIAIKLEITVGVTETIEPVATYSPRRLPVGMHADGYATTISAVTNEQPAVVGSAIYNMQGQRLCAPQRGLNIVGGKKVFVK